MANTIATKSRKASDDSTTTESCPQKQRRTPRACDRCRHKKLKCDGAGHCLACIKSDSPCLYTHRRNSAATKNYHWQMRDITNEAIRRMYVACKNNSGFPGQLPPQHEGDDDSDVSIHAILQGLGLISNHETDTQQYDLWETGHRRSNEANSFIPSIPPQDTTTPVPSSATESFPSLLYPDNGVLHSGLAGLNSRSCVGRHAGCRDTTNSEEQPDGGISEVRNVDEFNLMGTNGRLVDQVSLKQIKLQDGMRPVEGFLPAWSGTSAAASDSYDYRYTY